MRNPFMITRRKTLASLAFLPALTKAADQLVPDERDRQVLEAFLLVVLGDPDFGFRSRRKADSIIVLHHRTPEKTGMLGKGQMQSDVSEHRFDPPLGDMLRTRNTVPGTKYESQEAWFKDLKFAPRILVADISVSPPGVAPYLAFEAAYPKAQGWVEAFLPSYSTDGKQALARGWFGPTPHGATATALLTKRGEAWKVEWHRLAFYV